MRFNSAGFARYQQLIRVAVFYQYILYLAACQEQISLDKSVSDKDDFVLNNELEKEGNCTGTGSAEYQKTARKSETSLRAKNSNSQTELRQKTCKSQNSSGLNSLQTTTSRDRAHYLQNDPLGYVDSMNLYQGMNMNPYNFVDPKGESILHLYQAFFVLEKAVKGSNFWLKEFVKGVIAYRTPVNPGTTSIGEAVGSALSSRKDIKMSSAEEFYELYVNGKVIHDIKGHFEKKKMRAGLDKLQNSDDLNRQIDEYEDELNRKEAYLKNLRKRTADKERLFGKTPKNTKAYSNHCASLVKKEELRRETERRIDVLKAAIAHANKLKEKVRRESNKEVVE